MPADHRLLAWSQFSAGTTSPVACPSSASSLLKTWLHVRARLGELSAPWREPDADSSLEASDSRSIDRSLLAEGECLLGYLHKYIYLVDIPLMDRLCYRDTTPSG